MHHRLLHLHVPAKLNIFFSASLLVLRGHSVDFLFFRKFLQSLPSHFSASSLLRLPILLEGLLSLPSHFFASLALRYPILLEDRLSFSSHFSASPILHCLLILLEGLLSLLTVCVSVFRLCLFPLT